MLKIKFFSADFSEAVSCCHSVNVSNVCSKILQLSSLTIGLIAVSKSATEPTLYQYPNHFHFPSEEEIKFFNFPAPAFVCKGAKVSLNEEH